MPHEVSFPFTAGQTGVIGCVNALGAITLTGLSSPGCTNPALAYLVTQRPGQCGTDGCAQLPEQPAEIDAYVGSASPPETVFPGGMYANWNVVGETPLGYVRGVEDNQCLVVAIEHAPENGVVRLHFA